MNTLAQRYLALCRQRRKPLLIIDSDPGQDDAAAILMALGLQQMDLLEVLAITTVAGNVPLNDTSRNARIIADWAGRTDLPIYAGAERPLLQTLVTAEHIHGNTGLAGTPLHTPHTALQNLHAVAYLIDLLTHSPADSITLCAIGPLTNIAQMLSLAPEVAHSINEIVVMGGAYFHPGNITPMAEFNFYVDPHAAQIVLQAGVPLRIIPLDVTHQARATSQRVQALRQLDTQNGARLADILTCYGDKETPHTEAEGAPLHDPCAIACALWPELFTQKPVYVAVETKGELTMGATVVDWRQQTSHQPNAYWATAVDDEALFALLTMAINHLP